MKRKVKKVTKKLARKILPLMPPTPRNDITVLEEALGGDKELVLFFLSYLKHDRNATKAYQYLHPNVDDHVAAVLGSRKLRKVDIGIILESYGLGPDAYIKKIKEGMEATETSQINLRLKDDAGKTEKIIYEEIHKPNHEVQKHYHEKLGKLLGLEGKNNEGATTVAVQVNNLISDKKNTYGI